MKKILILLLLLPMLVGAVNHTVGTGGTFTTIAQVNAHTFVAGDSVLFKRGETFYGTLVVSNAGSSGNPVVYGAWGATNLAKPIITGFTTITGWTNEGSGIYSKVITSESQTNMVIIDGVQYGMGRYPNVGTYLTYESASTNISITDNQLTGTPSWTGAEAVITKNQWLIDRCPITNHTGSVITATAAVSGNYGAPNNYFFQNALSTLDQYGEWYHNYSTGVFYMYFGAVDTTDKIVQVATLNNLFKCSNPDYITIDNISFVGAIKENITFSGGDYVTIQNCTINFSGRDAIASSGVGAIIRYNSISDCNKMAIYSTMGNVTINNNTIVNCNIIEGQGNFAPAYGAAIFIYSDIFSIIENSIINCGFNGVYPHALTRSGTIKNNFFDNTCTLRNDQGAIYIAGNKTSILVDANVIVNSKGQGIYLDQTTTNTTISNNSVANTLLGDGIKIHMSHHNTIINNTVYNALFGIGLENWLNVDSLHHNIVKHNISVAKSLDQYSFRIVLRPDNYVASLATNTLDSNHYSRPVSDDTTISKRLRYETTVFITLSEWKTISSQDAHTVKSPFAITSTNHIWFDYNATSINKTVAVSGGWKSLDNATVTSYTLAPYESIILLTQGVPAGTLIKSYGKIVKY